MLFPEGREIMRTEGVKEFAKTASASYKSIGESEKDELQKKCEEESKPATVKDIKKFN